MSSYGRMNRMSRSGGVDIEGGLDKQALRRAWTFARPYRRALGFNVFTLGVATALAALPPLVFKQLIDNAIPHRNFGLVNWLFVAAITLALANTGLGLVNRWLASWIGESLIFDLRVRLYDRIQSMPIGFFTRTQTGSLLSRLSNDVVGAQSTVTTASSVASDVMTLTVTLIAMCALSWKVTLLALIVVPMFIVLDRKVGRRLAALSRRRMNANAAMTSTMQERFNVSGALLVKLFGHPKRELSLFESDADAVRAAGIKMSVTGRFYYGALAFTGAIGTAVVYWLGAHSVINGSLTIGTLTALAAYVTRLYEPLTGLASARVDLLTALVSFERCTEVLELPTSIEDVSDAVELKEPQGSVRFRDVSFRYPAPASMGAASLEAVTKSEHDDEPSDWILKHVDFEAKPGQTVALVGPSGAGKTTLSSLVTRLYDVDEGAVEVDGHDVRSVTQQSLHDAVGVVTQDTYLFHDTIAANLRYVRPEATDDEIVEACRRARIDQVIEALPDRYNTLVGERGYRLSGGEKQRLAIARVLLKQPAVIVLDEATAHLDSETESLVQTALVEALAGRTALVIAHRLSTVRSADLILVLEKGQIVERGTHDELVGTNGLYSHLYSTQYARQ